MWCMRPRDVIYKDYTHYVYYITYTPLYDPCKFFAILPMHVFVTLTPQVLGY
jgi:hypothetical protein